MKLNLGWFSEATYVWTSFMERPMFGWDFEVDAWSRFLGWNLIKICVWTCDMNSTLGSVVPLAMFFSKAWKKLLYLMISQKIALDTNISSVKFFHIWWYPHPCSASNQNKFKVLFPLLFFARLFSFKTNCKTVYESFSACKFFCWRNSKTNTQLGFLTLWLHPWNVSF